MVKLGKFHNHSLGFVICKCGKQTTNWIQTKITKCKKYTDVYLHGVYIKLFI
jgi:hypothetical protein